MDRKIGSYSLLILVSFVALSFGKQALKLRVVDKNSNKTVTHLALGVPYTLEVKAEGNQDLYKIKIPGIENFYNEFCGASHINLMSHITTVHNYVLRADKPGTFSVGPIQLVTHDGETLRSNILNLTCEQRKQTDVTVEIILDKTNFFVGQKMGGKVRFCTCIDLNLLNFQLPILDANLGHCTQVGQHQQSQIILDGRKYDCYEFPIELLFKQPGRYGLPKIGALCRVPVKRNHSMWGFSIPINNTHDQWYYSESQVMVQVDSLPPCPYTVDGIGQFDTARMSIDQTKASLGEGIVLTLCIEGKDGVHDFKPPVLNMPEGLKYYESKSEVAPLPQGRYKKSCEYIVQGMQPGTWTIPAHIITFFNPELRDYKRIKTNSVTVTIHGAAQAPLPTHGVYNSTHADYNDQEIQPLCESGSWNGQGTRSLAWGWFFLFLILPFLGVSYKVFTVYMQSRSATYFLHKRKKYAFKQIRKNLVKIKKTNNSSQLYDVFMNFFADRFQVSVAEMSSDRIEKILKDAGFLAHVIDQWNRFFYQLTEQAFFKNKHDQLLSHDVFNRAQVWINQLEEKL